MNLTQGIGYDCLNPQEKQLYDRFLQTFRQYGTTVDAGGISGRVDAMKVLGAALGDNPRLRFPAPDHGAGAEPGGESGAGMD